MGRKDVVTREYLSSDEVFADVVNLALYSGKCVVCGRTCDYDGRG